MNQEERILRENIRRLIRVVKNKKQLEHEKFRDLLGTLMEHELKAMLSESQTPDVDPTPNKSTGINVLEELLKKIVPVLETDFKSLTTNNEQRESFRAHIVNAVVGTLTPAMANNEAGDESEDLNELEVDEEFDQSKLVWNGECMKYGDEYLSDEGGTKPNSDVETECSFSYEDDDVYCSFSHSWY